MGILPEVKKHYGKLKLWIGGEWIDSKSTEVQVTTNPAMGEPIAEFPSATREEARAAVEAAQKGFLAWREVALRERGKLMFDLRRKFEERFDVLCRVLTQDHGRTIGESRGSVRRVIENVESACSAVYGMPKMNEHIDQLAGGIDEYMIYEPKGVFLIVTPGNIPMHAWSSFVPYALASGCSVVVSPSRQDPVAAEYICRVTEDLGLPDGAINLIHGGRSINEYILRQPEVRGLGFIGSTAVARKLFKLCGELGKDSSLNGNGKNCVVIMPDADIDQTVQFLLRGCFGMSGQRCLGSDNVVAVGDSYYELREKLTSAASGMKLGYGLDESVELGPMCTPAGRDKVIDWIDLALNDGCTMLYDGRNPRVEGYPKGYFLGPSVLDNAQPGMPSTKEEAFGPVTALMRFGDLDQVIRWHNESNNDLGHSACIMTRSGKSARKFIKEMETGNVGVNVAVPQPYAFFPLGSKKQSFLGSAKSRLASMRLFLDEKTVTARWV
ncbi:MAG: aldehyde dehydrogenase family protein [Deltaproteobacteria bacterium]|nr:aldehyde dehydrogenase family protein [Deltaproteobacteria bacterium]